jgi:hypothetical protein
MIENGSPILAKNTSGTITFRNQADDTDLTMGNSPGSHTHIPADVTGTAVIDNDARLTDARTPTTHSDSVHSGAAANLLAAITPTFANWSQNPGTNADLVSELMTGNLTTNGTGQAGNNTITYDLGSSKRCFIFAHVFDARSISAYIDISEASDFSSLESILWQFPSPHFDRSCAGKFRYIRYRGINAHTLSEFRLRVYQIS